MYLPFVEPRTKKARRQVVQFGGLNRTQEHRDGELVDAVGLSCREWPCLAQRQGRTRLSIPVQSSNVALFAWDELVVFNGSRLYYGGEDLGPFSIWPQKLAAVNTKLCFFPEKKYLEKDPETGGLRKGDLQATVVNQSGAVVTFGEKSVTLAPDVVVGKASAPGGDVSRDTAQAGTSYLLKTYEKIWWDPDKTEWSTQGEREDDFYMCANIYLDDVNHSSGSPRDFLLGRYVLLRKGEDGGYRVNCKKVKTISADTAVDKIIEDYGECAIDGYYGRIISTSYENVSNLQYGVKTMRVYLTVELRDANQANPSLETLFMAGDMVTISGSEVEANNRSKLRVEAVEGYTMTFVLAEGEGFTPGEETGCVKLCREVPELDFICEHDNRLIGLSNKDKTIYISALGDPRNFYDYRGLSVSSAYISIGSSGDFTGCISYGGNVLIFKEDCIIRLMGDYDGNYATYTDQVAGLQAGCEKSMVIINEVLYYKGRDGIYAYAGSTPQRISAALGDVAYRSAHAGTDGQRYYVSMWYENDEGRQVWELLAYDTRTGLWMKEEDRRWDAFARHEGKLYMASSAGLYVMGEGETDKKEDQEGQTDQESAPVAWEATFVPFTEETQARKYPSRLLLRLELGPGAWVEAEIARDGGPFEHLWTAHGYTQGPTAVIPIRPGRCDKYQLRLRGEGRCLLQSMEREFSVGGAR